MSAYERRDFLGIVGLTGAGAFLGRSSPAHCGVTQEPSRPGFRHDLDKARSVVGASHSNLDRVRELVESQPALAKAAWDWGFGDWESALGAASHTGARPIAEYLIAHGARPTLFSSAMLGEVDVVRALISANPDLAHAQGAH
ncbi:MAG: twin-arginine translocation signal domain-containing protein, partial [Gemmatimonadetes bacterium]|nr:twin-arginine translocation signal domain-containing protein [Gemmatimonadota bacterium]